MAQNGEKWSFFGRKMTIFRNFRAEIGSGGLSRGVTFKIWPKTNIFPCSHFSGRPGLAGYQSGDFVKNGPFWTKFWPFSTQNDKFLDILMPKLAQNTSKNIFSCTHLFSLIYNYDLKNVYMFFEKRSKFKNLDLFHTFPPIWITVHCRRKFFHL